MKQVFRPDDVIDLNPRSVYYKGSLCLFLKLRVELAQGEETTLNKSLLNLKSRLIINAAKLQLKSEQPLSRGGSGISQMFLF